MAFLILAAASALLLAVLACVLWVRRPPVPLWPVVFVCQIFALLWVLGDVWASNARTLEGKQIALLVLFSGSIPIAPAWWETVRRYVAMHGLGRPWMASPWARLPIVFGTAAWLLMITNPWHGQFITPVLGGRNVYGWGILAVFYFNYTVGAATLALCLWAAARHASPDVRRKMGMLAFATVAPILGNLLHLSIPSWPREDTTSIGLVVASLTVLYGIQRQRLFTPLPVSVSEMLRRIPSGLLVLDRGGRLVAWNPAAERLLEGIEFESDMRLLRVLAWQLQDAESGARLRSSRELTDLLTGGIDGEAVRTFRFTGSGTARWLELAVIPIPARDGHRLAAACLRIADVTEARRNAAERQALDEQMRELDKLQSLGRMAGGVAHDFNNLLTAILGNAELALDELPEDAPGRSYLEEIGESARLAAQQTDRLLAYAGRSELRTEPFSVSKLVEDMGLLVGSSYARNVELRSQLADDLPPVSGDPGQIRQVVLNLVANAAEAIGGGEGFITLRTSAVDLDATQVARLGLHGEVAPGPRVQLEVTDSGCGMDDATRRRIFEPFFSTRARGRGLGLATVFASVRAHRGAVAVESEPGRGTTIRIFLPVCQRASDPCMEGAPEVASPTQLPTDRCAVLVVEDQERVRRLAVRVLERAGVSTYAAANTRGALHCLSLHAAEIKLVLLDLTLSEIGGEEALRRMRRVAPDVRVVLTSGFDEGDALSRVSGEKVRGFLQKPWQPSELLAAVGRALSADAD